MVKPLIGITCHSLPGPILHPAIGPLLRSAVGQPYVEAIVAAGGAPLCIPLGLDEESLRRIYETIDGLLLPGGDDVAPARYGHEPHPMLGMVDDDRDELEITLATWALRDDLPVLGICRGIQVLAVAGGGTLYQDLPSEWESGLAHDVREYGRDYLSHEVAIEPDSRLATVLGCVATQVNSFHHQAVRDVPPGFMVSCRSTDGVVEAIESANHRFAVGVQCHPEGMWSTTAPHFSGLFTAFVNAAQERVEEHSPGALFRSDGEVLRRAEA